MKHIADISKITEYGLTIEFSAVFEPSILNYKPNILNAVAMQTEIEANSLTEKALELRQKYGRLPYGSPLYMWELHQKGKERCLYIGQTMLQPLHKRLTLHSGVIKVLAEYVNKNDCNIYFRICTRFDLSYKNGTSFRNIGIEHLPLEQARKVVSDVEAHLIYRLQPDYNAHHTQKEQKCWRPFYIKKLSKDNKDITRQFNDLK